MPRLSGPTSGGAPADPPMDMAHAGKLAQQNRPRGQGRPRREGSAREGYSKEWYRLLFEKNPLPMLIMDLETFRFLDVNEAAVRHYGYSREEFLSLTAKDIRPTEEVPQFLALVKGLGPEETNVTIARHRKKDGTVIDVEVRSTEIPFGSRRARLVLVHDVTDRLREERWRNVEFQVTRVLAESNTFDEASPRLLEAICQAEGWDVGELWRIDDDARVLRCTASWHAPELQGAEAFEKETRSITFARGAGLPGLVWDAGRPLWMQDVTRDPRFVRADLAARLGLQDAIAIPIGFGFPILDRVGVAGVMVFFTMKPRDPDDDLLEMMADIGRRMGQFLEQVRAEEAKQRSEERFHRAFVGSPVPIAITRIADGRFVEANESLLKYFGYGRDEVIGRTSLELGMYAEAADREKIVEALRERGSLKDWEVTLRTKDGKLRQAIVSVALLRMNGEPSILTTIVDVTKQREAERRAHESERLASMAQLAAYVAHEINNPLTNIAILSATAARKAQEPEVREKLEKIDSQRRMAAAIILDLLTLTRPVDVRPAEADLRTIVQAAVDEVAHHRKNAISCDVNLGDAPLLANVDPLRMQRVFANLVKNAYQATDTGTVTVRADRRDDFIAISVQDTGRGIPPELIDRLFQPFVTTKLPGQGTGLGLALARSLVAAHGGTIRVESEVGRGTTFTVVVPRSKVASPGGSPRA